MKKSNMSMTIEIEDDFIMDVIHEVFDHYKYNIMFEDSDKIKNLILDKLKKTYNTKRVYARKGRNFKLKTYVGISVKGYVASILWDMKKRKK